MRNLAILYKREMYSLFASPIALIITAVFLFLTGYFFFTITAYYNDQCITAAKGDPESLVNYNAADLVMRPLAFNSLVVILLLMPLITMRLYSEELKTGTIEFLLTSPVTYWEIVISKFLASLSLYVFMIALQGTHTFIIWYYSGMELGPVFTIYLGFLLIGMLFISFGNFTSSITSNQVIAAVLGFGFLLIFYVIGWLANMLSAGSAAELFRYMSIVEHFDTSVKGILSTRDVFYFLSFSFFALFLTKLSLESMKWRL